MSERLSRRELLAGGAALLAANAAWPVFAVQNPDAREKPRMKLGLVTYNIARDWDLPTILHNCKASGFEGVELRTTHAHGVEPGLNAAQRKEVRQRFADAGLTLWGLGSVCEFHQTEAAAVREQIETCKRFCELAQDVGAHGVKVRPNGLPDGVPVEKTIAQIGDALRECGQAAQAHGVEIWLEVHGAKSQHPPHIHAMLAHCQHPSVGACWNSNDTDLQNGAVKPYFDLLRPYLRSCHINNLWSAYPYRDLFALLQQSGYDRFTLCEVGTPLHAEDGLVFMQCYRGLWRELARP
jgi:sugar phosphate isomerase/epimerase